MKNSVQVVLFLAAALASSTGSVWGSSPQVVYAQVNSTLVLPPPAVRDLQSSYLYWFHGENKELQLSWRNPFDKSGFVDTAPGTEHWENRLALSPDNSLVIKGVQQEHFGTFVCEVTLRERSDKTTYRVLPINAAAEPPSPLVPGEPVTLSCSAETLQGQRSPQIHWLSPQGKKPKQNQGKLSLTVTGQDHGQWTCVVMHDKKESRAHVKVMVLDFSPAPSHSQYTSESWPLTIPCSIPADVSWDHLKAAGIQEVSWHFFPKPGPDLVSGDPQRLFSLTLEDPMSWGGDQNREMTPDPGLQKGLLSLTRHRGRAGDKGDYVCSMKLRHGVTLNRSINVKVLQIASSPGTDLISGQRVNLTCSLGEPLPSGLSLTWIPPEQAAPLSLTPDRHPALLSIPRVGVDAEGEWRCELWQDKTLLTSAVITLKIEPRLSAWMLVIICSVTVIIILLLILVFIVYKRRQRKMMHIRHRLCKCKNPKPKGFYRT